MPRLSTVKPCQLPNTVLDDLGPSRRVGLVAFRTPASSLSQNVAVAVLWPLVNEPFSHPNTLPCPGGGDHLRGKTRVERSIKALYEWRPRRKESLTMGKRRDCASRTAALYTEGPISSSA